MVLFEDYPNTHRLPVGVIIKGRKKLNWSTDFLDMDSRLRGNDSLEPYGSESKTMPKSREQKAGIKERLVAQFKSAKSVVFADYQGITVPKADEIRKKARAANVGYMVAKKSLFTLAAKEAGYELNAKQFPGMLGAAFGSEDEIAPAKVLGDLSKTTMIKLVGDIFEGQVVGADKVIALS